MTHEEEGMIDDRRKRRAERRVFRRQAVARPPSRESVRNTATGCHSVGSAQRRQPEELFVLDVWAHSQWHGAPVSEVRRERRDEDQP